MDVIVHVLSAANKGLVVCKHCWHFLSIWTLCKARCGETSVWLGELCAFPALTRTCWLRQILPLAPPQHAVVLETLLQRRKPVWGCMIGWWKRTAENISILVCKIKTHSCRVIWHFLLTDTRWMLSVHVERANVAVRCMTWALRPCKHSDCLLTLAQ